MLEFDRAPFGVTGLETAVGLAFSKLQLSDGRLIELFSINPQKIMKVVPWGLLEAALRISPYWIPIEVGLLM